MVECLDIVADWEEGIPKGEGALCASKLEQVGGSGVIVVYDVKGVVAMLSR